MSSNKYLTALATSSAVSAAAAAGGLVQSRPSTQRWFKSLRRPPLQPPDAVFGPVWSVLYAGLAWHGKKLFEREESADVRRAQVLWSAQLALNAAWTPTFFGLKQPKVALANIVALDATVLALKHQATKIDEPSRWILNPYLAWLAFATYLNASIVWLNPDEA